MQQGVETVVDRHGRWPQENRCWALSPAPRRTLSPLARQPVKASDDDHGGPRRKSHVFLNS